MALTVYALLGTAGEVLYVGSTTRRPSRRAWEHKKTQPWAAEIHTLKVLEVCLTYDRMLKAERKHIVALKPLYNVVGAVPAGLRPRASRPDISPRSRSQADVLAGAAAARAKRRAARLAAEGS